MHSKDIVAGERASHAQRYVAMFLWMSLCFLYVFMISQWLTVNNRDKLFTEYIDHVIQVAANEQLPAKEVRALILIRAGDLFVPVHDDEIQITGKGVTLRAAVHYKVDISLPIVNQPVYRMRFDHDSAFRPLQ